MIHALRQLLGLAGLALLYSLAGKSGLTLASVHASATAVWPPTGIALAALIVFGVRMWPAVFVGALFVNVTTAGTLVTAVGIATGNTLEAVVGALMVNRWAGGRQVLERGREVFLFSAIALACTTVSATLGVASLLATGYATEAAAPLVWFTWWLGDVGGAMIITPTLVLWARERRQRWTRRHLLRVAMLFSAVVGTAVIVFGAVPQGISHLPIAFLCLPVLLWAAYAFGPTEAATSVVLLSGLAVWGTVAGYGPFAGQPDGTALVLLQSYMAVAAIVSLALAAVTGEQRRTAARLRALVATDPLTGMVRYRPLLRLTAAEIAWSSEAARPFTLLYVDVLEQTLNGRYDNAAVAGTAVARVAEIVRHFGGPEATPSRFANAEFVVLLPGVAGAGVQQAARSLRADLRTAQVPDTAVRVGWATYPRDGGTPQDLLNHAMAGVSPPESVT